MYIRWRTPCGPPIRWGEWALDRQAVIVALTAVASDGVAVDRQRVQQHLRVPAVGFGALRVLSRVADQCSVAVRPPGQTLAAVVAHNHV